MSDISTATCPFGDRQHLSSGDVETLRDWLAKHADPEMAITAEYRVQDLIDDLDGILAGMWNDGIDAMGEDA